VVASLLEGTVGTVAAAAAAALSALWLAHVVAFALRQLVEYRDLKRLRNKPVESAPMAHVLVRGVLQAAVFSLPRWLTVHLLGIAQAKPDCNCYFDDDCWSWRYCDYSADCTRVRKDTSDCPASTRASTGSCDGRCVWGVRRGVAFSGGDLAPHVERYFDVFIQAARTATGQPTTEEILAVDRTAPDGCRSDLKRWVLGALEIVLGWDLIIGERDPADPNAPPIDAFLAHIADPDATPAILMAARDGLAGALRAEDPDRVVGPLEAFWERYPGYLPAHTGRCYPHGHEKYESAIECQIAQLRWRVGALLSHEGAG
jgi:hypothetical protein